jgi:hypothetical protein
VEQIAMRIRGSKDTFVHLTLERNGQWLEKDIRREDGVFKTVQGIILNPLSCKVSKKLYRKHYYYVPENDVMFSLGTSRLSTNSSF